MKATFKSMMVIGMMILGTITSFASNNIDKDKDKDKLSKPARTFIAETNVHNDRNAVYVERTNFHPGIDKKMHKHFNKRKHSFDKHGHCKKCHYTAHEIRRIEREMHLEHRHHDVHHKSHQHHHGHGKPKVMPDHVHRR